ncbi:MAG: M66 family metalloprotease [Polyangiaceae bacterium]
MSSAGLLRNPLSSHRGRALRTIATAVLIAAASGLAMGACTSESDPGIELTGEGDPLYELVDASGVSISQISVYQGVKILVMENGLPAPAGVPIVAGRDALMRLWLNADPAVYNGQPLLVRLHISGFDKPIEIIAPVPGVPVEDNLQSTFNIQIPGSAITPGFSYRIEMLQPRGQSKGANPAARYPAEGYSPTNTVSVGNTLRVTIVPIRYNADGSGRLPDTSEATIQGYRDYFHSMYAAPSVELTVREPIDYNKSVGAFGNGWDTLLAQIGQVRANDQAPFDAYYYGIFAPAKSINQYCSQGCVAGLGNIAGVNDPYARAAIGLGFEGDSVASWETAVHEVGHNHGRFHAPCGGAGGPDSKFPYSGGATGVWGYDLVQQRLFPPQSKDVMGYCYPIWVSDYTYNAFLERIQAVNAVVGTQQKQLYPQDLLGRTYDRALIDGDGNLTWVDSVTLELPPESNPVEVTVDAGEGPETLTGNFYEYDHLPGGVFLWPQPHGAPARAVTLPWKGALKSFTRD